MAQVYSTGPALIYVGIPIQFVQIFLVRPPAQPPELRGAGIDLAAFMRDQGMEFGPGQGGQFHAGPDLPSFGFMTTFFRSYVPVYLGTCEESPLIELESSWLDVPQEEGGAYPVDQIYDGERAWVEADLNRYNEVVYMAIAAKAANSVFAIGPFGQPAPRGIDLDGYVGTMAVAEGAAYPLWVVFPFWLKAAHNLGGMPPGYRFYAARLGNDRLGDLGPRPRKVRLVWQALRVRDDAPGGSGANFLYDHDMRGLTGAN